VPALNYTAKKISTVDICHVKTHGVTVESRPKTQGAIRKANFGNIVS
jgi:hypothetical protein